MDYYTLNSLSLFWLGESVQWIFEISACDVITADYTIIMSRTFKVRGNYVMYDRGAWYLRVARFVLLAVSEEAKHDFHFFPFNVNKTIIRYGFRDIQNNQGLGKGYQPQPSVSADNRMVWMVCLGIIQFKCILLKISLKFCSYLSLVVTSLLFEASMSCQRVIYRKLPKVTILITFGISSLWARYFRRVATFRIY